MDRDKLTNKLFEYFGFNTKDGIYFLSKELNQLFKLAQ